MSNFVLRQHFHSEYGALRNAIHRCHCEGSTYYANYGGRGIEVCDEWRGPDGFIPFFCHIGPKPTPAHTLDRIDNNAGYERGNVRWADRKTQGANRRKQHVMTTDLGWGVGTYEVTNGKGRRLQKSPLISWEGQTQTLAEWADELGLERATLRQRFAKGWPLEKIMTSELWAPSSSGPVPRKQPANARQITAHCIQLLDEAALDITGRRH